MDKIHAERLLKLANHLGTLSKSDWAFEQFGAKVLGKPSCKTVGCAIGQCPTLFPSACKFERDYTSTLDKKIYYNVVGKVTGSSNQEFASEFFGLDFSEAEELFIDTDRYRVDEHKEVTPKMVSKAIIEVLEEKGFKVKTKSEKVLA